MRGTGILHSRHLGEKEADMVLDSLEDFRLYV